MATILLADNYQPFAKTQGEFLEIEGYTVILAFSPEEARNALRREQIDLLISDLRLTDDEDRFDRSGLTLIKEAIVPHKILMSSLFPQPVIEQARGICELVEKTAGAQAMVEKVKQMLQQR